jgi:nucleoside-diphosphate-sugar epimerase
VHAALVRDGWRVHAVDRADCADGDVVRALAAALTTPADAVLSCAGATSGPPDALVRANADLPAALAAVVASGAGTSSGVGPGRGSAVPAVPRFVHVGSAAEYGAACGDRPCTEDDAPAPLSEYGRSKAAGTERVLATLPGAVVLRATTVIGPGGRGFLATLCRQIAAAPPDGTVHVGPLDAARDLLDVDDLAAAVVAAAHPDGSGAVRGVLNVGTGVAVPLSTLVARVRAVTGFRGAVVPDAPAPATSAQVRTQCSDTTRITHALAWTPRTPLDDTIRRTWLWVSAR